VFAFYQFWLNTPDADAMRYLHYFTFETPADLADLAQQHIAQPQQRAAQRLLASEVTRLVHGADALARVQRASAVLFEGGDLRELSSSELSEGLGDAPRTSLPVSELEGMDLPSALVRSGLAPSKGQARTSIEQGAVSVNHEVVKDATRVLTKTDLLADRFVVLRRGKKTYGLLDIAG
jgi:tyrosyl-tRNA synthetase